MAAKKATKKATKKSSKKDDKPVPYMELIEIAHCNMVERGVADKSMCLIYQKISDSESKTVYIYQGTDVRLLHKIERLKNKNKNYVPPIHAGFHFGMPMLILPQGWFRGSLLNIFLNRWTV